MIKTGRAALLALTLAAPALAQERALTVAAYDPDGTALKADGLRRLLGRADGGESMPFGLIVRPAGGGPLERPRLEDAPDGARLRWTRSGAVQLALNWPVPEDGFSAVWLDNRGEGYPAGARLVLNEEIARAQHRLLTESLKIRMSEWTPRYEPGGDVLAAVKEARGAVSAIDKESDEASRAAAADKALRAVSSAWQKALYEHGKQIAQHPRHREALRFGLTLDESFSKRLESRDWIIRLIRKSGANWVRLVFRYNPEDFVYANPGSFLEYDVLVKELREAGLRVMGSVLDTARWPATLTPEVYARRTRNLVLRYKDQIRSWEVGSEINGDWHGGSKTPLGLHATHRIFRAGAAEVKSVEPSLETVATLYWWDSTAPDEEHSLSGWLAAFAKRGLGKDLDVLGLSLEPEDNPVGMGLERIFAMTHEASPETRLMLGSFGFGEKERVSGYWWLDPKDLDAARQDVLAYYTPASCAMPGSLCGGFWWQTLSQMLPEKKRASDLYHVFRKSMEQIGR